MDRISQVPEFIIHHIMSFLKSPKERVRMSVLSKHLFAITASFPILDFKEHKFGKVIKSSHISSDPNIRYRYVMDNFFKYVDYTTSRFCQQNVSVHTFKLIAAFQDPSDVNIADRCLESILMKGVQVLVINGQSVKFLPPSAPKYRVSNKLLSASSLTSLTLCECELPSSLMVDAIEFKSLKHLRLQKVPIDKEVIERLTTSCPLLEEFIVEFCWGLKRFCVYGLQNLQELEFRYDHGVERIDIDAPNLCFLLLMGLGGAPCLNVASCKKLTTVYSYGYPSPRSEGLVDLSSNFPHLETLFLILPQLYKSLKLSSHSLRTFVLHSDCDLDELDINTPNLLSFDYKGHAHPPFRVERESVVSKARMECYPSEFVNTLWFQKLRRFLSKKGGFKELKLCLSAHLFNVEELKLIQGQPFELDHVDLEPDSIKELSVYLAVVDGVLWCCRPQSLTIESNFPLINFEEWSHIVKFTYEKLIQQEDPGNSNIQFVISSSSIAKKHFDDLTSLLIALPRDGLRQTITIIKEAAVQEAG
ncbi:F-box domain, Leucine-rich repeat domain, L domain-like protein [Artemisia annua]|uniref:F-box domain, Leucine-rich repeat domain, L domain-like protein n=1 Tax=Artemisia annua TaxID=35608 RepID=A0A2U1NJI8_ARTAN|nr:F-box domain, Leucine-rich repeat domain, L domain-like protein [Artemisia annua]